nr:brain-specific angiogenesis inhibitor 1-associated protein 2-like protein 2 [Vulpes vulpes]
MPDSSGHWRGPTPALLALPAPPASPSTRVAAHSMAPEMDQFYRSTMAIYKSIMEQFNPALENLVYLGNNYLRAFHALSEAAEVYFNAIQKIGEQALQSSTSQILGEILVQMSDTQRHLNSDLEVVVQTFHGDLLQHMEKNTKLDMQFIKDSCQHYELEYHHRATNLEKCMSELWRMERKRDKNVREMKESVNRLHAQMQAFMSESQRAAELEEKRRYRFLAEKHLLLSNTFLHFFGRDGSDLSGRARVLPLPRSWALGEQGQSTRPGRRGRRSTSRKTEGPWTQEGWAVGESNVPGRQQQRSLAPSRQKIGSPSLGARVPGPGRLGAAGALGPADARVPRGQARGVLQNRVLLWKEQSELGLLLMGPSAPRRSGWFPEAYVKPLEEMPMSPMNALSPVTSMNPMSPMNELPSRSYPLRGSHSLDDLLGRPGNSTAPSEYWDGQPRSRTPSRIPSRAPSPAPPPLPSSRRSSMGSTGVASDVKKLMSWEQQPPELFPRGTNPFATVKLRPTVTNDRSAPLIR